MLPFLTLSHPWLLEHGRETVPENFLRLQAILSALKQSEFQSHLDLTVERLATRDELALIHTEEYVDKILSQGGKDFDVDHETHMTPGSLRAARLAAGLGIELVERVIRNEIERGFALVRPPGHHARPSTGMGFCIFNNIAIAAKRALQLGVQKVLILDWDVHHGNGTQEAFYESDQVLFVDIHQENLFPADSGASEERGQGRGAGYTLNIPMPHSSQDDEYLQIFDAMIQPRVQEFKPELILVSAGFDAHENDPLGSMRITTPGFGRLTQKVRQWAKTYSQDRMIFFLEGGYEAPRLAENVVQCIKNL